MATLPGLSIRVGLGAGAAGACPALGDSGATGLAGAGLGGRAQNQYRRQREMPDFHVPLPLYLPIIGIGPTFPQPLAGRKRLEAGAFLRPKCTACGPKKSYRPKKV